MKSIELDYSKRCADEPGKSHNRWHPDIPPVLEVDPGEEVVLQTRDATDGQISWDSTVVSLANMNPSLVHPLTGPVWVNGAEPGDLLEIETLAIEPATFGYTSFGGGLGLIDNLFSERYLVRWSMKDGYAESLDLPGAPFMGTIGVAPSRALLTEILRRETELRERGGSALPPNSAGAVPAVEPIASEGLRTRPPRENGGNMDIKGLTAGSRLFLPAFVQGALFSAGDGHFAQGDGECCGTAIEMTATLHVRFRIHKGEAARRRLSFPFFETTETKPALQEAGERFLVATGFPIADGKNESGDATVAARNAVENMIKLLCERGYSREQAYAICSVAVDLRLSEVVNLPNFGVSAHLPLGIFTS